MNLEGISNRSLLGKALRCPLRLIPKEMQMPIMQGKLKGKKWIVGSGNHGCWLGTYEYDKQRLFSKTITKGSIVFDVGGHVGFYTLLSSELVGSSGKVYVFEPVPRNISHIRKHIKINGIMNVSIIEAAVSNESGSVYFDQSGCGYTGCISNSGDLKVNAVSLDDMIYKEQIPTPSFIKMDIEGAEGLALYGAKKMLENSHPTIFLATHGSVVHKQCCNFLTSFGYQLEAIDGMKLEQSTEVLAVFKG